MSAAPPPASRGSAHRELIAFCDGASRGNPGPAGIGVVLADPSGRTLVEISDSVGTATNNQAEYRALLRALETALAIGASRLRVHMDSELVVLQMQGIYRVRNAALRPLWEEACALVRRFESVELVAVRRELNSRADELASRGAAPARRGYRTSIQSPPRSPSG
ncbi:MAG: ribonuclease HI family protein [Bacteroidetes bacterium]|nr:ribonuclease HI family protein [Bacteroidota bacterium]